MNSPCTCTNLEMCKLQAWSNTNYKRCSTIWHVFFFIKTYPISVWYFVVHMSFDKKCYRVYCGLNNLKLIISVSAIKKFIMATFWALCQQIINSYLRNVALIRKSGFDDEYLCGCNKKLFQLMTADWILYAVEKYTCQQVNHLIQWFVCKNISI